MCFLNQGMLESIFFIVLLSIFDGHSVSERWYDLTSLGNMGPDYVRAETQMFVTLLLEEE